MKPVPPSIPRPVRPRRPVPRPRDAAAIPGQERAFFVEEFRGITILVALPELSDAGADAVARSIAGFEPGDTRFVLVLGSDADVRRLQDALPRRAALVTAPEPDDHAGLARLWLTVTDSHVALVAAPGRVAEVSGNLAAGLRATKVVLTDPGGGWGDPPRSFADLQLYRRPLQHELDSRGLGQLLPAAERALRGGAYSVNLCRAEDLEAELFTFDGAGTLMTLGGYLTLAELRVDDLPAVEALIEQGVRDGVLKARSRAEIARIATGGMGARVIRTGHLAGVVGLETDRYTGLGVAEVSGLITVSEFSGAGAGGLLLQGLLERAGGLRLRAVFAVTVSDNAAEFFLGRGFTEVGRDAVPGAKWAGYDPARQALARCFWRDVPPS